MKFEVSQKLISFYSENCKNPNYSLSFLLSSIDPQVCTSGIVLPDTLTFSGTTIAFEVDDKYIQIMQKLFEDINASLVERLLWIALLLPEI